MNINKEEVVRGWVKFVETVRKEISDITIMKFMDLFKTMMNIYGEALKDARRIIISYPEMVKDILEFIIDKANEVVNFSQNRVMNDPNFMADAIKLKIKYTALIKDYEMEEERISKAI